MYNLVSRKVMVDLVQKHGYRQVMSRFSHGFCSFGKEMGWTNPKNPGGNIWPLEIIYNQCKQKERDEANQAR